MMEVYILTRRVHGKDLFTVFTTRFTGNDSLSQLQQQNYQDRINGYWQREIDRQPEVFSEISSLRSITLEKFNDWEDHRDHLKKWANQPKAVLRIIGEHNSPVVAKQGQPASGAAAAPSERTRVHGFATVATQEPA